MVVLITTLLGGIGLFLLGMVLLTDGLKAVAGEALRRMLVRFTGRPLKAFVSGTLVTLLVQSSSATTVTVIGFVSAGLLTFPQAVGVVFGASFGTTGTGWIVSLLGFKLNIGFYALPLVGVGMLLRLLAGSRGVVWGTALAGFGLIFVGIDTLQRAMEGVSSVVDLAALPRAGFVGDMLLLLVGAAMTVIMQSSSAATATTLAALYAGSITFEQACSLVIGASIGTTFSSALAAIGASVPARRTALAHVLFNLVTGVIAVVSLPLFLRGIAYAQVHFGLDPGPVSLAAFHSAFTFVGIVLFLPFATRIARGIEWLLPERGPLLTRHLDTSLLNVPAVALEATHRALIDTACELFSIALTQQTARQEDIDPVRSLQIQRALEETQEFLARISALAEDQTAAQSTVDQLHAIDHLVLLQSRVRLPKNLREMLSQNRLEPLQVQCRHLLELAITGLRGTAPAGWGEQIQAASAELAELRRQERTRVLRETASGRWEPGRVLALLDAMRWLDQVGYHAWRVCYHLSPSTEPVPAPGAAP